MTDKIKELRTALQAAAPHNRDYYPQAPVNYAKARVAWENDIRALEQMERRYTDLALHCHDQLTAQKRAS